MDRTKPVLYLGLHSDHGISVVLNEQAYKAILALRERHGHTIKWGEVLASAEIDQGIALFAPTHRSVFEHDQLIAGSLTDRRDLWRGSEPTMGSNHLGHRYIPFDELVQVGADAFVTNVDALHQLFGYACTPVQLRVRLRAA